MKQKQLSNKPAQQPNPQQKTHPISREQPDHSLSLADLVQRTRSAPHSLSPGDVLHLQTTFGNRYIQRILQRSAQPVKPKATSFNSFNNDNTTLDTPPDFLEAAPVTNNVQRAKTKTVPANNPLHQPFKRQRRLKPNTFKNKPRAIRHPGKIGEMYQGKGFAKQNKGRNPGNRKSLQLLMMELNFSRSLPKSNPNNTFNTNSSGFFPGQLNTPLPLEFPPTLTLPNFDKKRKRDTDERGEEKRSTPESFKRKKRDHRLDDRQVSEDISPFPITNESQPFKFDFFENGVNGSVDSEGNDHMGQSTSTAQETPFPFVSPFSPNFSSETSAFSGSEQNQFQFPSFSPQIFEAPNDFNFNDFGENQQELNEEIEENDNTEVGIEPPGLVNEGERLTSDAFPEYIFTVTSDTVDNDDHNEQDEELSESISTNTEDDLNQWPTWDHLPETESETAKGTGFNSFNSFQPNDLNEDENMGVTSQPDQFEAQNNTESQLSGFSEKSEQNSMMEAESQTVESETHTLYAAAYRDEGNEIIPTMMIQSIPLPVGTFITEMKGRYNNFIAKVKPSPNTMKLASKTYQNKFKTAETAANNKVTSANKIFASKTSNFQDKQKAEADVAKSLDPVIKAVMNLAKATSVHLEDDSNKYQKKNRNYLSYSSVKNTYTAKNTVKEHYYVNKLSTMAERYRLEGLVAKYDEQPDYLKSGLERDHQPHNALLEKMAEMPEFKGRKLMNAAAGRSKNAESIMLHHKRHAAGRTFGGKAPKITKQALTDIEKERIRLAKSIKTDVDGAVSAVKKLTSPDKDGKKLITALGEAKKHTDKAQKGDVDEISEAIKHLAKAEKLSATAKFNKKALNSANFNNAVTAGEKYGDNIRDFCVNYLITSRDLDVSAMKNVIAVSGNFSDLKQTGLGKPALTKLEKEIKNQITDGENRIKSNDDVIKAYAGK